MNYYDLLEVSQNASKEVIRAAYKSLMQRYHPDKNPGDAEIAHRAALLVQAYEVLSDTDKRSAYDLRIKSQPEIELFASPQKSYGVTSSRKNHISARIAEGDKFSWYPWLLISVIILSGWLILSLSKKQPNPLEEIHLPVGGQFSRKNNPAVIGQTSNLGTENVGLARNEKEIPARTIPLLSRTLKVSLRPSDQSAQAPDSFLSIPVLLVKVGSFDSEKFMDYLDTRKASINLQLEERLAEAKHEKLIQVNGEHYLKEFILDALGDITGTSRFEDYPSSASESPGRYGITEVFLPESFLVK